MYRSVMESQHSMLCCCGSSLSMPSEGCWLRGMFGYATRMQFDLYSLKAVVSHYLPSHYLPSKRQVSHGLILCLFDPDPDPDPVALGGLHPGVSSVHLSRRHWPTAFLPGESAALASDPLASPAGSPASGLLLVARKRAPTGSPASGLLLGRPQAGSYAERLLQRLVKLRLRVGALAPLRTLWLCGESLDFLKAAPLRILLKRDCL
jgi:hypothetical protein